MRMAQQTQDVRLVDIGIKSRESPCPIPAPTFGFVQQRMHFFSDRTSSLNPDQECVGMLYHRFHLCSENRRIDDALKSAAEVGLAVVLDGSPSKIPSSKWVWVCLGCQRAFGHVQRCRDQTVLDSGCEPAS